MHYYQFNIGDYAKDTRHLSNTEDLAYRRLIDLYYDKEQPLIKDVAKLSRLINMRDNQEEIATVLDDFFEETEEGYKQSRIEHEIANYHAKADAARANGKKGGRPRKAKTNPEETQGKAKKTQSVNLANPEETQGKAKPNPEESESKANQEPMNQEPKISSSRKNKFSDDDMICADWIHKRLVNDGIKPKKSLDSWANTIRLIVEVDGKTHEEICNLFKWANSDSFWKSNILSPEKLRKQWDQLTLKRGSECENSQAAGGSSSKRNYSVADRIRIANGYKPEAESNGFLVPDGGDLQLPVDGSRGGNTFEHLDGPDFDIDG